MENSIDTSNWKYNCDDYILDIISIRNKNNLLLICSNGKIVLLERKTGELVKESNLPVSIVFFASNNSENDLIIVGTDLGFFSIDSNLNVNHLYSTKKWAEKGRWNNSGNVFFGAIGKNLCVFKNVDNQLQLVLEDASFESSISAIICKDDAFIVSNYGGVRLYESGNNFEYELFPWKTSLLELAWSPDKKYIASGTQENAVHFWPYPFKKEQDFEISGYESKITHLCWSEDSTSLAINGSEDICIWPFIDGPPFGQKPQVLIGGKGKITTLFFKNNTVIAGTSKGYVLFYYPSKSNQIVQLNYVANEVTQILVDEENYEFFVGTKEGEVFSFDIEI